MPLVCFNVKTGKSENVNDNYNKLINRLKDEKHQWLQFIDDPYNLYMVEGFREAASKNFISYHLHHRAGRYADRERLKDMNLYFCQPPEMLMFMKNVDHSRYHALVTELNKTLI